MCWAQLASCPSCALSTPPIEDHGLDPGLAAEDGRGKAVEGVKVFGGGSVGDVGAEVVEAEDWFDQKEAAAFSQEAAIFVDNIAGAELNTEE